MFKVVSTRGDGELAMVFIAELEDGARIEFVESVQPPVPRDEKWVLIVSTLRGCPVGCPICDAGGSYAGKLSREEIIAQIEYMVRRRFPNGVVPIPKLKIQFARMGDPAFNDAVLDTLEQLPRRFELPGLMPSISTVAPAGRERFFERLLSIKNELFGGGRMQMQFSVHTTDEIARRRFVPIRTWSLEQMARYGERFFNAGDRKITLNFAPARGVPLEPRVLAELFDPARFMIKLTPINPTYAAAQSGLVGLIDPQQPKECCDTAERFTSQGFDVIVSIGELEENAIGSNCGMYVTELERRGRLGESG